MAATPTRERLVTEAMKLFSERGFEATSVSQIEAAAGLSAGSGALYRHFKSKDALLAAGIDRQLDRRAAMQDIRALFGGLGDLHSELTVLGRYLLTVIDQESELLRIAARTPTGLCERLDNAYAALIDGLRDELTGWIRTWAPAAAPKQARMLARLGINSLLGERTATHLFHHTPTATSDAPYLREWTETLAARVNSLG
ncbi:putative transcriptional regulator, TetR family protein [Mycolicibacterium anyangense]|uniref:Putative transcriptional regulator, TetR family protein n=1 Tax=Mycolicibacterium anyangense TaxID=1431246 RepID=A0A6N4WDJ1_9MYCO|nr:TetR/AcrR family transcriptional regulator [Mycolicibacterium anyangense]BBZ78463.1 putative transcriptional regulator, TetR family protein [Mycolicibacterium anyangense]